MVTQAVNLGKGFLDYAYDAVQSRRLIFELTRREFRGRYLGSAFGLTWAFIHPAVIMMIYWIVFQYGLRVGNVGTIAFLPWLLVGFVPWFYVNDWLALGTTVILENHFLVKKIVFRVSLLPLVRLLSLLPVHLFFIISVLFICWGYGYAPTVYDLQLPYYLAAVMILGIGVSWLTSALSPFLRDTAQVMADIVQVAFWATPIAWPSTSVPQKYQWILWLNPIYYVVRGYRECMLEHQWFWNHPIATTYFWIVTATIFVCGGLVFKRLMPHFADVL